MISILLSIFTAKPSGCIFLIVVSLAPSTGPGTRGRCSVYIEDEQGCEDSVWHGPGETPGTVHRR